MFTSLIDVATGADRDIVAGILSAAIACLSVLGIAIVRLWPRVVRTRHTNRLVGQLQTNSARFAREARRSLDEARAALAEARRSCRAQGRQDDARQLAALERALGLHCDRTAGLRGRMRSDRERLADDLLGDLHSADDLACACAGVRDQVAAGHPLDPAALADIRDQATGPARQPIGGLAA
jgi:hypothetical protein